MTTVEKTQYLRQGFEQQCAVIQRRWQEDRVKLTHLDKRIFAS